MVIISSSRWRNRRNYDLFILFLAVKHNEKWSMLNENPYVPLRHPVVAERQTRTFGLYCLEWCSAVRYYSAQWGKMSYMLPASYIPYSGSDFEVRYRLCSPAPEITLPLHVPMTFSEEVAQAQWKMSGCLWCAFPGAGSLEDNWE